MAMWRKRTGPARSNPERVALGKKRYKEFREAADYSEPGYASWNTYEQKEKESGYKVPFKKGTPFKKTKRPTRGIMPKVKSRDMFSGGFLRW